MSVLLDILKDKIVVGIVSFVLIVYVISTLAYVFSNTQQRPWPPFGMTCPDYWISSKADGGYTCTMDPRNPNMPKKAYSNGSVYPIGGSSGSIPTVIFSKGNPGQNLTDKKDWARESKVSWDGMNSSA